MILNEINYYSQESNRHYMRCAVEAGFFAGVLGAVKNNIQATLETIKEIENKKEAISA